MRMAFWTAGQAPRGPDLPTMSGWDSIGFVNTMASLAVDGRFVLIESTRLALMQSLGGLQQRRCFFLPTRGVTLGCLIQRQGFVVFDKFGKVLMGALAFRDFLCNGVVAFVQSLHHFLDGVFGFVLSAGGNDPNHLADRNAGDNNGTE